MLCRSEFALLPIIGRGIKPGFRLDFNGALRAEETALLIERLGTQGVDVEFLEDPCPFDLRTWNRLQEESGMALAIDRDERQLMPESHGFVRVWKPAYDVAPKCASSGRLVVTSNMDHAIGQAFAAFEAARFPEAVDTCGLATHLNFESDPFFARLGVVDGRVQFPREPGLGFGAMLEALPWKTLTDSTPELILEIV